AHEAPRSARRDQQPERDRGRGAGGEVEPAQRAVGPDPGAPGELTQEAEVLPEDVPAAVEEREGGQTTPRDDPQRQRGRGPGGERGGQRAGRRLAPVPLR